MPSWSQSDWEGFATIGHCYYIFQPVTVIIAVIDTAGVAVALQ